VRDVPDSTDWVVAHEACNLFTAPKAPGARSATGKISRERPRCVRHLHAGRWLWHELTPLSCYTRQEVVDLEKKVATKKELVRLPPAA
jgi:hypothetical protein